MADRPTSIIIRFTTEIYFRGWYRPSFSNRKMKRLQELAVETRVWGTEWTDILKRYPFINAPMNMRQHVSMMRCARRAALLPIPATLREFGNLLRLPEITAKFGKAEATTAAAGNLELFFRTYVEGTEEEGDIAVFASPFMVAKLQQATEIHLDGTFSVCMDNK